MQPMSAQKLQLVLLDDVGPTLEATQQILSGCKFFEQYDVQHSLTPHSFSDLSNLQCDIILYLIDFPDSEHLATLNKIQTLLPMAPVIIITLKSMLAFDLAALEHGASDVLILNNLNDHQLNRSIEFSKTRHQQILSLNHLLENQSETNTHDAITNLPNRQLFQDRLDYTLKNAHRYKNYFGILVVGLDGFKIINETLGHRKGDTLLTQAGKRIGETIRRADTLARLGGDEFIIILSQINHPQDVLVIAEHILAALSKPYTLGGRELFMTASIGISRYPDDGLESEDLLKHAYAALYDAKSNGKNQYQVYHKNLITRDDNHLTLSNDLHRAIEREEFEIYYQPQLDLKQKMIYGFEALIRWIHPHFGIVSPSEFIPIAETNGLIVPISEWVMANACQQLTTWHAVGLKSLSVSINISAKEFQQSFFVDKIKSILNSSQLSPHLLSLEITESILMQNPDAATQTLRDLRSLGVKVSIDDFGTGYSSLSYLKTFPIDTLKIDRSFVRDLIVNKDNTKIVKAIIGLAHSLQLNVVAEGVENEAQKKFLTEHDCHLMQGFLFSKPLPVREATQLLLAPETHLNVLKS